jgi:hypothetical protein
MSTTTLINSEAVRLVCEAANEVRTIDGLDALMLVLEKMHGKPGFVTADISSAQIYVRQRVARLPAPAAPSPGPKTPPTGMP